MTTGNRWPQVGDLAVDVKATPSGRDRLGSVVTVKGVRLDMLVTSDGEKYDRDELFPYGQPHSAHRLVPLTHDRVLIARGRYLLDELALLTDNLAKLDHRTPDAVAAALAQIVTAAHESRQTLIALMAEASKAEQESNR